MTLVRETGSEIIAQFTVPTRGTWRNVAIHTIPLDALYDSLNVFVREGKLRNRPGLTLLDDTLFLEPVLGGFMVVTPLEKTILAITQLRIYQLSNISGQWSTLLAPAMTNFAPNNNSVVDMTFMETAGSYVAVIAQENNVLKQWTNSPLSVSVMTGTNIPTAKSVCTAASRIIALISPHTVVWSNTLNPNVYSSLAYAKRAQTGDVGVCVKPLSALSFVLYKERSIHMARAQAGLDEGTAFIFLEPLYVEGPAGIYAVVNVNGTHIYMTKNGRVAMFNGTSYPQWLCDGLWFFLQEDIDQTAAHKIRGVYDYRLHTVTFFYPKINSGNGLRGMVTINLPLEGLDTVSATLPHAFLGLCAKPVTHACEKRFDSTVDRSLIITQASSPVNDARAFIFDELSSLDGDLPFNCMFQTGLQPMPDARHTHVSVETFLERNYGYGSAFIEPVISDALENSTGTIPELSGQWIDLESNPIREYKGFGRQVRFFGLKYSWSSINHLRYSGAVVYASSLPKYRK